MSTAVFYRTVLPTSWAIVTGIFVLSKVVFQPRTNCTLRHIPKSLEIPAPLESSKDVAKVIHSTTKFPMLHPRNFLAFHPVMKLFAEQHAKASPSTELTVVHAPSTTLKIIVPEGTEQSMVDGYRNMDQRLQALYNDNALSTITDLYLSVPWKLQPQRTVTSNVGGVSTVATLNLRTFEWHGKIDNLPSPWRRGLDQFDFSALETLVLRDCMISVEDCLFLLRKAPKLKRFTVHAIYDVPARITKGLQSRNQPMCPELTYIAVVCGDVDLKPLWDALNSSCHDLETIVLKPGLGNAESNIRTIPWINKSLKDVKIRKNMPRDIETVIAGGKARNPGLNISVTYQ
ncbi:hypothetical protein BDQ17DRAFT_1367128 [Cyathus striatus]|nr:hypothetical protein BDQ17DRAFT_1367128 [Cyathus striatus]